jgi:hypothetical protein
MQFASMISLIFTSVIDRYLTLMLGCNIAATLTTATSGEATPFTVTTHDQ